MRKTTFLMVMLALPLSLTACELVSDGLEQQLAEEALKNGPGGEKSKQDESAPPRDECKPVDKEAAEGCMHPEWWDEDQDGCIDHYACLEGGEDVDGTDPKDPAICKPIDKEESAGCIQPLFEDRDGDGCIDYYVCLDSSEPTPAQK